MSHDTDGPAKPPAAPDLAPVVVAPNGRFRFSVVWVVPLVAALIGVWLAWKTYSEQGPTVALIFKSGDGLEPGKTVIKYRDVEVGKVTDVALSGDRKQVIVTADLRAGTDAWLVDDTRFWVVRPRVVAGSVSGLGTLLSGAFIGMDVGQGQKQVRDFVGLDTPPILTYDKKGQRYVLKSDSMGSLDVGTPIYYRHIPAGQVLGFDMNPDGRSVTLQVFVGAPYDQFVTKSTHFWHASGVDLTVSASGVRLDTESLISIAIGGIAFGTPEGVGESEVAQENHEFWLFPNQQTALARPQPRRRPFILHFKESMRGLTVGAPVDFLGLPAGEVTGIHGEWDPKESKFRIAVEADIAWGGIDPDMNPDNENTVNATLRQRLQQMIDQGLRAQLRTSSLISGQLYVALDFFRDTPRAAIDWSDARPEFPTKPGALQSWSESAERVMKRLDQLPVEQLITEVRAAVSSLDATLKSTEKLVSGLNQDVRPEIKTTLGEATRTLSEASRTLTAAQKTLSADAPLQREARDTLKEVGRAAQSLRLLADFLERHPQALLLGKEKAK